MVLAFLTHASFELCGFVGSWRAKDEGAPMRPMTLGVKAVDPAAASAALAVVSSAASVLDFLGKGIALFEQKFLKVPLLPGLSSATTVKATCQEICMRLMSAQQTIILQQVEFLPEQLIEGTGFQRLMITVS